MYTNPKSFNKCWYLINATLVLLFANFIISLLTYHIYEYEVIHSYYLTRFLFL